MPVDSLRSSDPTCKTMKLCRDQPLAQASFKHNPSSWRHLIEHVYFCMWWVYQPIIAPVSVDTPSVVCRTRTNSTMSHATHTAVFPV
eukprot:m.254604 g.254604  ORF g.254604 m.254604 type:complete len:87 (+) comp19605_c0_seq2:319-579(+)